MIRTGFNSWQFNEGISIWTILLLSFVIAPVVYYVIMFLFLKVFGKPDSIKKFFLDRVALTWPFHHLGLTLLILFVTLLSEVTLQNKFQSLGFPYISLFDWLDGLLIDILIFIAFLIAVNYFVRSRRRMFVNHKRSTWLTEVSCVNWFQGVFASIVCFLLIVSGIIIVYHWGFLLYFFNSTWLPSSFLSSDPLFGTSWIKDILLQEFLLIILLSFDSVILSFREKKFGSVKRYTITFIFAFLGCLALIFILTVSYNHFLASIKENLLSKLIFELESLTDVQNTSTTYDQATLGFYFEQVSRTADSIDFPGWLDTIIGLRLVIVLMDVVSLSTNNIFKIPDYFSQLITKLAE